MADLTPQELKAMSDALVASGESAEEAAAKVGRFATANKDATEAAHFFQDQLHFTADGLSQVGTWLSKATDQIANLGNLTGTSAVKFGLLTTALVGSKEHFTNFLDSLNPNRLGSLNTQLDSLTEQVSRQGTGLGLATEAGRKLFDMLGDLGIGGQTLSKIAGGTARDMAAFAKNVLVGADNSLKLESAMLQAGARAGNLNEMYQMVGENLGQLNEANSKSINVMFAASQATHKYSDEMAQYYGVLAEIPGGLESMTNGLHLTQNAAGTAGTSMNALAGIIQLADGMGMDIKETFQDIHKEVTSYGLSIDAATKLVGRYADVSSDLGAQQEDVRAAIKSTTDVFKGFVMVGMDSAKMTQGLTDAVKNWAGALEKAGVPAQQALEQASRYTSAMQGMSEAQEAFISAQTGGAGGMLGALKFEDLLRKDPAKASAEIADTMKKYMSRSGFSGILSREEAISGGQGGARQYELQRQLAMSGVFGIKAKNKEEADTMIAALKSGTDLSRAMGPEAQAASMQKTLQRGAAQEQLSATQVDNASITADYASLQAGNIDLGFLQNALTARSGQTGGEAVKSQARMQSEMTEAGQRAARTGTAPVLNAASQSIEDVGLTASSAYLSARTQITGENTAQNYAKDPAAMKSLESNTGAAAMNTPEKHAAQAALKNATRHQAASDASKGTDLKTLLTNSGFHKKGESAETPKAAGQTVAAQATGHPIPVTLVGSGLTVNFTGKCPHCGFGIHTTEQAAVQSASSTLPR
jgi:hypothetical protein